MSENRPPSPRYLDLSHNTEEEQEQSEQTVLEHASSSPPEQPTAKRLFHHPFPWTPLLYSPSPQIRLKDFEASISELKEQTGMDIQSHYNVQ